MKRIFLIALLSLLPLLSGAQRVTGQFGGYFQFGKGGKDTPQESLPSGGIFAGAQLEPFYPWPIYLETGLGLTIGSGNNGSADVYRLELPLDLTWQWEPLPNFSIGPYGGVYGVYHMRVSYEYGNYPDDFNTWSWGWMGGVSIRPWALLLNVGYYQDMLPLRKDGVGESALRAGKGIRISVGWCF